MHFKVDQQIKIRSSISFFLNLHRSLLQEQTANLIKELIKDLDTLKASIIALPPHTDEKSDISAAIDLQHEETEKLKQLQEKIQESEETLKELHNAYEIITTSVLKLHSTAAQDNGR